MTTNDYNAFNNASINKTTSILIQDKIIADYDYANEYCNYLITTGSLAEHCNSKHGNFVIQSVLIYYDTDKIEKFINNITKLYKDKHYFRKYECRVISKLVLFHNTNNNVNILICKLLKNISYNIKHEYNKYILYSIIDSHINIYDKYLYFYIINSIDIKENNIKYISFILYFISHTTEYYRNKCINNILNDKTLQLILDEKLILSHDLIYKILYYTDINYVITTILNGVLEYDLKKKYINKLITKCYSFENKDII